MVKEEIRIEKVIIHILDSLVGMPVLSDTEIDFGSDFADFIKEHIYKISSGDDVRTCRFYENESEVYQALQSYNDDEFIPFSKQLAESLYKIMNSNVDIPSADLAIVRFRDRDDEYLAILKIDLRANYTHRTSAVGEGNANEIVKFKAVFPTESQRLSEAAIIRLKDFQVQIGQVDYFNGLVEEAGIDEEIQEQLRELIENKNYFGVDELLTSLNINDKTKKSFLGMADLFGGFDVLSKAKENTDNEKSLKAVERLEKLYKVLEYYKLEETFAGTLTEINRTSSSSGSTVEATLTRALQASATVV